MLATPFQLMPLEIRRLENLSRLKALRDDPEVFRLLVTVTVDILEEEIDNKRNG